jgi:phosphoglycerate dehydrogenase-like enzyme
VTPKIIVSSRLNWGEQIIPGLEAAGCEVVVIPHSGSPLAVHVPDAGEVARYWRDADGFIVGLRDHVTREVLEAATNLKAGASPVIGTEHIDLQAATDLGILIAHGAVPENFLGVAEAVVMLAAALIKQLPAKSQAVRAGGWRVDDAGRMVTNSVIGLLGLGKIGRAVARRFQGWDTTLIAADPYVDSGVADELGVKLVDLDTLLRTADVVSVMVTLTDETRHLIGERELALMKPGAYLINTARGGCVDEAAVIRALDGGHLGGVAIDAWDPEPSDAANPLRTHPKVIATGHNVGHSREVYAALPPAAVENLSRAVRGETPPYVRNPEVLPRWRERLARLGIAPVGV